MVDVSRIESGVGEDFSSNNTEFVFSMSIQTLKRIDGYLSKAALYSVMGEGYMWHSCLLVLYREAMSVTMAIDQRTGKSPDDDDIQNLNRLRIVCSEESRNLYTISKRGINKEMMNPKFYTALQNLEIALRQFFQKKGMLMKEMDTELHAMD